MKVIRVIKECPILIGIASFAIVLTIVGCALKSTVYAEYAQGEDTGRYPALSLIFKGARDGVLPWSEVPEAGEEAVWEEGDISPQPADSVTEEGGEDLPEESVEDQAGAMAASDEQTEADASFDISGNNSDMTEGEEEDRVYEFTEVDDDYFCDALFIGDSRTVGLSEYCEELDTRATFYSKVSLTIFTALNKEFVNTEDGKITVDQALQENQFGKIYIMLGLNEAGTGSAEYFRDAYAEVVNRIEELQPDAIIYIQGIMHVTVEKSSHDKYFNNDNINERNAAISELADQKRVFYIDMNEAVDDGNGNLDSSLSFDGVHLKASSYERWHQFLLHNAIVR